ncbi:MAG: hypothetical protein A2Y34_14335 [Spirochaetes bacterium GWC1_27_15]|nr:MAG: hypothetical protein A2Z98_11625 [Spirochaetes bacterium GWB1_27_13]OHD25692.1 MAG: hypothetical protein A2Y34_14335 [Spirochaetes bacterium GWC1_27_15]
MKKINLILAFIVISFFVFSQNKIVYLVTLDWPPYISSTAKDSSPQLANYGYVAEIAYEAFKKAGYELKIDFKPWERAVKEATDGDYDGLFPEYYGEERKKDFVFSDPFPGGPLGFYKRKDFKIKFSSLKDLKDYKIGVVRGYINTVEFDNATYLQKEDVVDDETNIKKLYFGRINLIVIDKFVGEYLIKTKFPNYYDELEFLEPPLEVKDLYIVFSKKSKDYQQKLKDFNKGLAEIKKSGLIDKILKKQGFK